jgi:molybdopterin-guanine dinucleotide biosynthesis protein A
MTGVILAGGKGRRLGQPKALALVGGQPIIHRILRLIEPLFDELLIVADQGQGLRGLGVELVADMIPGSGPLGGIYSGLCRASSAEVFCFAGDMPFLNVGLIEYMINNFTGVDALVPRYGGRLHPLHAIYSQACREPVHQQLIKKELRVSSLFPRVRVGYVTADEIERFDPAGYGLFNVNTRQDLDIARGIAGRISHQ